MNVYLVILLCYGKWKTLMMLATYATNTAHPSVSFMPSGFAKGHAPVYRREEAGETLMIAVSRGRIWLTLFFHSKPFSNIFIKIKHFFLFTITS